MVSIADGVLVIEVESPDPVVSFPALPQLNNKIAIADAQINFFMPVFSENCFNFSARPDEHVFMERVFKAFFSSASPSVSHGPG